MHVIPRPSHLNSPPTRAGNDKVNDPATNTATASYEPREPRTDNRAQCTTPRMKSIAAKSTHLIASPRPTFPRPLRSGNNANHRPRSPTAWPRCCQATGSPASMLARGPATCHQRAVKLLTEAWKLEPTGPTWSHPARALYGAGSHNYRQIAHR